MHRTRIGCLPAAIIVLVSLAGSAGASPVLWETQGLTFTDGGTGSGYFILDRDTNRFWNWNLVTTSGNGPLAGFSYTPLTSFATSGASGCGVAFVPLGNDPRTLCLQPESDLIAGATPALLGSSYERFGSSQRLVSAGLLSDPKCSECTIPEPSAAGLIALGAACGLVWRRFQLVRCQ